MWNALKASLEPDSLLLKTQLLTEIVNFTLKLNSNSEESLIKLTKLMSSFNALTCKGFSGSELSLMLLYTKISFVLEVCLDKAQESAMGFMAKAKLCTKHKSRGRSYTLNKCFDNKY